MTEAQTHTPRQADRQHRLFGFTPTNLIAICLILAVSAAPRLSHVTQPLVDAYSWREANTALIADGFSRNGWNILRPEVGWIWPEPRYPVREVPVLAYLAALLNAAFGWHDWTGRLVAVAFGLVTTLSLHRLTALLWSERHAHGATLAYALMPAALMADTSYVPEPAMIALVTLGVWLFVRYWALGGAAGLIVGVLSLAVGILSKSLILGAAPVAALVTAIFVSQSAVDRARRMLLALGAVAALVAACLAWGARTGTLAVPYGLSGLGFVWDGELPDFLSERFYLSGLWRAAVTSLYGYPYLFLFVVGLWSMPTTATIRKDAARVFLPMTWVLAGVAVYVVAARWFGENPWNLYTFNVPLAMFAGRALVILFGDGPAWSGRGVARRALTFGTILAFSTVPLITTSKAPYAEDSRQLGLELANLASPGDPVVALSSTAGDPVALYYSRAPGWLFPPGGGKADWSLFPRDGSEAISALEDLRGRGAVWFGAVKSARDGRGRAFLEHNSQLLAYLGVTAAKVVDTDSLIIYRLRPPG